MTIGGIKSVEKTQCQVDIFSVTTPGNNAPPQICGTNSGEHSKNIYIPYPHKYIANSELPQLWKILKKNHFLGEKIEKILTNCYWKNQPFILVDTVYLHISYCYNGLNPLIYYTSIRSILLDTLFRKKRFEINLFVQRNASKFAIFIEFMTT